MEIFLWIVAGIAALIFYGVYSGTKREHAYQAIIADLQKQLTQNPVRFFAPDFQISPDNRIGEFELTELLIRKIMLLALERKVRSPLNANIIPSDINTLVDAKQDFMRLYQLAYAIANEDFIPASILYADGKMQRFTSDDLNLF